MNSIYLDLILSSIVYVLVTYLSFQFIKRHWLINKTDNDDSDGGFELTPPQIDLPPGVSWPSKTEKNKELENVI